MRIRNNIGDHVPDIHIIATLGYQVSRFSHLYKRTGKPFIKNSTHNYSYLLYKHAPTHTHTYIDVNVTIPILYKSRKCM